MKKILSLSLVSLCCGFLALPLQAAEEDNDLSDLEEYDLYDRNRDDRDFNRYNYPDMDQIQRSPQTEENYWYQESRNYQPYPNSSQSSREIRSYQPHPNSSQSSREIRSYQPIAQQPRAVQEYLPIQEKQSRNLKPKRESHLCPFCNQPR